MHLYKNKGKIHNFQINLKKERSTKENFPILKNIIWPGCYYIFQLYGID